MFRIITQQQQYLNKIDENTEYTFGVVFFFNSSKLRISLTSVSFKPSWLNVFENKQGWTKIKQIFLTEFRIKINKIFLFFLFITIIKSEVVLDITSLEFVHRTFGKEN